MLGSKLFVLYINNIGKVSNVFKFVVFADDTNIFCHGENLQQLSEVVSKEISKLKDCFDINKLSLNLNKTKFMLFGNRKINDMHGEIDVEIKRVYENI